MQHTNISHHPESYLTASTVGNMIKRVKEMGGEYFACADNGTLASIMKTYGLCKDNKLKIIAGIEIFFKDENCTIIQGTQLEHVKYFKLPIYFQDQDAYQVMVKMVSDSERKQVKIKDISYPLFNWSDLEYLAKYNIKVSTSNIEDMVSKHLLFNRYDLSKAYYEKLKVIFGDKYTPAICTTTHTHYQDQLVKVTLASGLSIQLPPNTRIETNSKGFRAKAMDLITAPYKHQNLLAVYYNKVKSKLKSGNHVIMKAELVKTFIPFSDGDLQRKANENIINLHNGQYLINNNSYYVDKTDKIVQTMKLGVDGKELQPDLHIKTDAEVALFLRDLGCGMEEIKWVFDFGKKWASSFDGFELKYGYKLVDYGPNPEKILMDVIKERGRMKWDNPRYVKQLQL